MRCRQGDQALVENAISGAVAEYKAKVCIFISKADLRGHSRPEGTGSTPATAQFSNAVKIFLEK